MTRLYVSRAGPEADSTASSAFHFYQARGASTLSRIEPSIIPSSSHHHGEIQSPCRCLGLCGVASPRTRARDKRHHVYRGFSVINQFGFQCNHTTNFNSLSKIASLTLACFWRLGRFFWHFTQHDNAEERRLMASPPTMSSLPRNGLGLVPGRTKISSPTSQHDENAASPVFDA